MLLCGVEHTAELLSAGRDEGFREIKEIFEFKCLGKCRAICENTLGCESLILQEPADKRY
jgi:hypothetical protein